MATKDYIDNAGKGKVKMVGEVFSTNDVCSPSIMAG